MNEAEWINYVIRLKIVHTLDLIFMSIILMIVLLGAYYLIKRSTLYLVETKQLDKFQEWDQKRKDKIKKCRDEIKKKGI